MFDLELCQWYKWKTHTVLYFVRRMRTVGEQKEVDKRGWVTTQSWEGGRRRWMNGQAALQAGRQAGRHADKIRVDGRQVGVWRSWPTPWPTPWPSRTWSLSTWGNKEHKRMICMPVRSISQPPTLCIACGCACVGACVCVRVYVRACVRACMRGRERERRGVMAEEVVMHGGSMVFCAPNRAFKAALPWRLCWGHKTPSSLPNLSVWNWSQLIGAHD